MLSLLALLACATVRPPAAPTGSELRADADGDGLASELVVDGPIAARLATPDAASLVLFYGGEEAGSLETCGCPNRPRGGLGRAMSYIDAARAVPGAPPDLLLNGGGWLDAGMALDGSPRADAPVINRWMVMGLSMTGPQALNLGYPDMAGLRSLEGAVEGLPVVSANLQGLGVAPYVIVERGDLKIGITGISTPGSHAVKSPDFTIEDPVKAGRAVIEALRPQVDLLVLLAYAEPEAAASLARQLPIDLVIDTNAHRERYEPIRVGQAVWVRSHLQTMRLGELRLELTEGRITGALDRKIDLDPTVPDRSDLSTLARMARREIDAAQRALFGKSQR